MRAMVSLAPRTAGHSMRSPKPSWRNVWVVAASPSATISRVPISRSPAGPKECRAWPAPWGGGDQTRVGNRTGWAVHLCMRPVACWTTARFHGTHGSTTLRGGGRALLHLVEHGAGFECLGRVERFLCHEYLLHDPRTIDDERRSAGDEVLFVEDAVGSANVSRGIAQNAKIRTQLISERRVGPGAVHANAENHRVVGVELARCFLILRHFARAARRERRGKERQHDVFLAFEIAKFDLLGLTPAVRVGGRAVTGRKGGGCVS